MRPAAYCELKLISVVNAIIMEELHAMKASVSWQVRSGTNVFKELD